MSLGSLLGSLRRPQSRCWPGLRSRVGGGVEEGRLAGDPRVRRLVQVAGKVALALGEASVLLHA